MCGSEELIHDARQVDLEEMIMTNETPMYLVPGRLTDEQDTVIRRNMIGGPILDPADIFALLVRTIGTPIQPCADVETVGWVDPDILAIVRKDKGLSGMTLANMKATSRTIPLVRRTDMEAQIARVAAEKDAEIARLKADLYEARKESVIAWSVCASVHREWAKGRDAVFTTRQKDYCRHEEKARAALNEGAAG